MKWIAVVVAMLLVASVSASGDRTIYYPIGMNTNTTINNTYVGQMNQTPNMTASNLDTSWNLSYYLSDTSRSLTGGYIHRDVNNDFLSIMGGTGGLPYGGNLQLYGGSNVAQSGGAIFAVGNAAGTGSEVVWSVLGNTDAPQMSMSNNKIIDLLDPTNPQDAATKHYVDSVNASLVTGDLTSTNPIALSAAQHVVGGNVNVFLRNDMAETITTIDTALPLLAVNYTIPTSGLVKEYVDNSSAYACLNDPTCAYLPGRLPKQTMNGIFEINESGSSGYNASFLFNADVLSLTEHGTTESFPYIEWINKSGYRGMYLGWGLSALNRIDLVLENGRNLYIGGGKTVFTDNVGIGTLPAYNLHIKPSGGATARIEGGGSGSYVELDLIPTGSGVSYLAWGTPSGNTLEFYNLKTGTGPIITLSGLNTGFGTGSPQAQIDMTAFFRNRNCSGTPLFNSSGFMFCISDEKAKENIKPYTDGLSKLKNVHPITYDMKPSSGIIGTFSGFSAQNLLSAGLTNAVITRDDYSYDTVKSKDGKDEIIETKTGTQTYSVDLSSLVGTVINGLNEEDAKVTSLRATIEAQQKTIDELTARLDKAGIK